MMLNSKSTKIIKQIIYKYLPKNAYEVFIFGSRATGTSRKFSDIDLGINGPKALSAEEYVLIKSAFDESDLPYRVDLVDFKNVSDKFKQVSLNKIIKI